MNTKAILLAVSGVGVIGGSGAGAYYLLKSPEPKNIKEKLIKDGTILINTDDEYEVSFKELKETPAFITALKEKTSSIEKGKNLQEGATALKKWCEENGNLDLSEANVRDVLPKVKEYCKILRLTIAEKLKSKNKGSVTNWTEKINYLKGSNGGAKNDADLATDLSINNLESAPQNEIEEKLKNWCNENIKTKINAENSDIIWTKAEKRCVS